MRERRIVFVHAHPDDETLTTGGTIARYADEGVHVCLITCTNGEEGEIADLSQIRPDLGTHDEIKERLGEIRRAELQDACRHLGAVDLRMLGYHDSGMDGTPENDAPHAFVRQDIAKVTAQIVSVLEDVQPQVLVTYNEYGGYGHPDHIRAHEAALAAARSFGVEKIYYTVFPRSLMRGGRELFGDDFFSEEEVERIGTDDDLVTATVDVAAYLDRKFAALEAHRTQLGTTKMFLDMPHDVRELGFASEYYQRVDGDPTVKETDLFA